MPKKPRKVRSKQATKRRRRASSAAIAKMAALVEREVQRRAGPSATFEQRNDLSAEVMQEVLFKRSDDDLRSMVAGEDEEEVEDEEGRYRRLTQPSSATYVGRWGGHFIEEPLYRKLGERNGPTIKPIELRAGLVEHMTPDMARLVGGLSAELSSRELHRLLLQTGFVPPGRAFLERRAKKLAAEVAKNVEELEEASRAAESLPAGVASVSFGLDRMSVRMSEPVSEPESAEPRTRTKPYKRTPPAPCEYHYRKAWVGSMSLYDADGVELRTLRYGRDASADPNKLADRVAADVAEVLRLHPDVHLHCVQDGAPELRALPEALARTLPANTTVVELIDFEHLMGYLDKVVDACEPEGDPLSYKSWYRGELLRDDGAIDRIWLKLRRLAKALHVDNATARTAVAKALSYIRRRKDKMRYASHYAAKLPIGSGATESTCWQMQQRVKRPAQSWRPEGLRGVMSIRGLVLSDRWDTAWPAVAARHIRPVRRAA